MGGGADRDVRTPDEYGGRCDASDKLIDDEKQETRKEKQSSQPLNSVRGHTEKHPGIFPAFFRGRFRPLRSITYPLFQRPVTHHWVHVTTFVRSLLWQAHYILPKRTFDRSPTPRRSLY